MSQELASRILNSLSMEVTAPVSSSRQTFANTGCWRCGDEIEFFDSPDGVCIGSTSLGKRTIDCIDPNSAFFFDSTIDLTTASGTVIAVNNSLDDQQAFNDRLCSEGNPHSMPWIQSHTIASFVQDSPGIGQMTVTMSDSTTCYQGGDPYKVLADDGVVIEGNIVSVNNSSKEIVLDDTSDLSLVTGEKLANCCDLSLEEIIQRFKDSVSGAADCEDEFDGDCHYPVFESSMEIIANSTKPELSGRSMRKGVAGTRASLSDGAANQEIVFTSMVLNTNGNSLSVEIVNAGGTGVTVSGNFPNMKISVNNNSGAATVSDIATAIHADADARRLVQVSTGGGDGSGLAAALTETNLAGGLDDATHDYAELLDENGELRFISMNILKSDRKRYNKPPSDSEWVRLAYQC